MDKNTDHVTERELLLVKELFGHRVDSLEGKLKLWVALAVVGGNAVAGLVAALVTRTTPSGAVSTLGHVVGSLF